MTLRNENLYHKAGIDVTSASFHDSSPSWSSGIFSLKVWTEDTPPGSDMSSASSSRASSSEYNAAALERSISQDDEPISYAEVVSTTFHPAQPNGTDGSRMGSNSATGKSWRATFPRVGRMTHRNLKA